MASYRDANGSSLEGKLFGVKEEWLGIKLHALGGMTPAVTAAGAKAGGHQSQKLK